MNMTIHKEMEEISEMANDLKKEIGMTEEELEAEFDRKYAAGDFDDQMILDDDLPDFRDNWISEQ